MSQHRVNTCWLVFYSTRVHYYCLWLVLISFVEAGRETRRNDGMGGSSSSMPLSIPLSLLWLS